MGVYSEKDCKLLIRSMTLKDDLRGEIVLLDSEIMSSDRKTDKNQFALVTGGAGCTLGYNDSNLEVTHLLTGLEARINKFTCIGVAKEEILPDWVEEKRKILAPRPIQNEEWFKNAKPFPQDKPDMWGEHRLLCEFDEVMLLVTRKENKKYRQESPQTKHSQEIYFSVQVYEEKYEDYLYLYGSSNIEDAKVEFSRFAGLVSEENTVTQEEAKILVKACETTLTVENYADIDEEMTLHRMLDRLQNGLKEINKGESEEEYDR